MITKAVFVLFLSLSAVFLTSCGKANNGNQTQALKAKLGNDEYIEVSQLDTNSPKRLSGSGSIVFNLPRPADDNNYNLAFTLEPGGTLVLVTNSDNRLQSGAMIQFVRRANDELGVTLFAGQKTYDLSADFTAIDAKSEIKLNLDVHGHGHVIFFRAADELEYAMTSVAGKFWGLKLFKATVTTATADKARENHGG